MPSKVNEKSHSFLVSKLYGDFFACKEHRFYEFRKIRNIFLASNISLHKPFDTSAVDPVVPFEVLKQLFEVTLFDTSDDSEDSLSADNDSPATRLLKAITNEDMENFRIELLKIYKINYCNCGCTPLMLNTDREGLTANRWKMLHHCAAMMICAEKETMR